MKVDYEVSEPNTMQAIVGSIVAISSFAAAYAAHMFFPVKPIDEADILLAQSTVGTVNILSKDSLEAQAKTPRELIDFYLKRKANLEDVIELVTGKSTIPEAFAELQKMPPTPETVFLMKVTQKNYATML